MSPEDVRAVCQFLAIVEALVICALYGRRMDWRDGVAQHIYAFVASIGAVCALGLVRTLTHSHPDHGWFAWLNAVVFAAIPAVLAWRLVIIIKIIRRKP